MTNGSKLTDGVVLNVERRTSGSELRFLCRPLSVYHSDPYGEQPIAVDGAPTSTRECRENQCLGYVDLVRVRRNITGVLSTTRSSANDA